jgi:hypothetical protein
MAIRLLLGVNGDLPTRSLQHRLSGLTTQISQISQIEPVVSGECSGRRPLGGRVDASIISDQSGARPSVGHC